MDEKYLEFINRFSHLTDEELHYKTLYQQGYLPTVPDYIKEPKDLMHNEDAYIPNGEITIRKHPCYLPNYIHDHAFLEIPMVLRGRCKQRFYGREFMMEEGDALIIAPRTYHSISVFEDDTVTINLLVKMETLKDVLAFESKEKKGLRSFFEALRNEDVTRTCVLIRHSDEALRMLPYLEDQSYRPLFLSQLAMYFALLFKGDEYTFPITPTENNDRLTSILESIRNNPKEATLTTIADEYGLSPGYLSAMIHEKTGLTFSSLVAKRKVQIATKLLLQDENASNIAIAERIGMNPQQFCRFFRKWLGMTPKEYRERNRKKPIQYS